MTSHGNPKVKVNEYTILKIIMPIDYKISEFHFSFSKKYEK